jgi:hypothetical protein
MLRIAVLALVAVNLLYFGWSHWAAGSKPVLTAVASTPGHKKPPPPPPCATLGPFHDALLADQAEKAVGKFGWRVQRRAGSEQLNNGWWVYVSTASTAEQVRVLDAIRRSGMRDAFAMPDDAEFRVSAGVFSDQARAEDRATRVKRLKLDAVVQERHRQQPVIWLDLPGIARATLGDGRLDDSGLPLDALRIEECPTPAPANSTPDTPAHTEGAAPVGTGGAGDQPVATDIAFVIDSRDSTAPRV